MAKDPAFLFYPGDFNTGTQFMSDEQVGKYMRLLMAQHQHGHLTDKQVIIICKSYDNDVMCKFKKDSEGKFYNERLEIEVIKRKNFIESRSKNKEGKTKPKIISKTSDSLVENRNRNRNTIEISTKESVLKELLSDELYMEQLNRVHKGKDFKQAFEECYIHHSNATNPPEELGEWKQKVNTWLINTKSNVNGQSNKTISGDFIPKSFNGDYSSKL